MILKVAPYHDQVGGGEPAAPGKPPSNVAVSLFPQTLGVPREGDGLPRTLPPRP
jgi:hypothetical protein